MDNTNALSTSASGQNALAMRDAFEQQKAMILRDSDIVTIKGRNGQADRSFIKRSGWRIISAYFDISDEIVNKEFLSIAGKPACIVTVRATTKSGRSSTGIGMAQTVETKGQKTRVLTPHDMLATAHTRAKNRAVADLVGAGEVSAEEIGADELAPVAVAPAPVEKTFEMKPVAEVLHEPTFVTAAEVIDEDTPPDADAAAPSFNELIDIIADELVLAEPGAYKDRHAALTAARDAVRKRKATAKCGDLEAARGVFHDLVPE